MRPVHNLGEALKANQHLLQELQHCVKIHIGLMTSLIRLRARDAKSEETRGALTAVGDVKLFVDKPQGVDDRPQDGRVGAQELDILLAELARLARVHLKEA